MHNFEWANEQTSWNTKTSVTIMQLTVLYESSETMYCFQIHHIGFFEIIFLIHFSDKESQIHSHLSIFVLVVFHLSHCNHSGNVYFKTGQTVKEMELFDWGNMVLRWKFLLWNIAMIQKASISWKTLKSHH